jgi:putative membrane protein
VAADPFDPVASRAPARETVLPAAAWAGLAAGIALFTALVAWQGVREVGGALAVAGTGLLVVAAFHLVPMFADALGWRALFAPGRRPPVPTMLFARWVGESVNGLLPVMQVGGNVAKAAVLARRGVPGAVAGATVVANVTLITVAQVGFTLLGICLLLARLGGVGLALPATVGTALMALCLAGFVVAQRRGLFGVLGRLAGRVARGPRVESMAAGAAALDAQVAEVWRDRRAVAVSIGWHILSWAVGAGEVWLALGFLGHSVGLGTAVMLESLGQAVRAGAFVVPGALGVQEGGYLVLGGALGLPPETALALSLCKRVRELVLGLPGLLAWQLDRTTGLRGARRQRRVRDAWI